MSAQSHSANPMELPDNLPRPEDDGAANHLAGAHGGIELGRAVFLRFAHSTRLGGRYVGSARSTPWLRALRQGGSDAIICPQLKARTEILAHNRQRIHAGRMLSDFPNGVQDMRPEEARDAKHTAEQVVRAVLDWLDRYPAA